MILDANDPRLAAAPDSFVSPFPSNDALYSEKFQALGLGLQVVTRAQGEAWRDALALSTAVRATTVGVLTDWLPDVASMVEVAPGLVGPHGLWAKLALPEVPSFKGYADAVANIGLDIALDTLGAVPIVGGCLKFILNLGTFLDRLFKSKDPEPVKRLLLPWEKYSSQTDGYLVDQIVAKNYYGKNDWTNLFLSPFAKGTPWKVAAGVDTNGKEQGAMFAPVSGGQLAYSTGLGGIPGTFRVMGYVQSPAQHDFPPDALQRYFNSGALMRWGRVLTATGDFYPALAQTLALAWQQVQAAGAPEMFTVDTEAVEASWVELFDQFFDGLWRAYDEDEWAGEFGTPYLALGEGEATRLGLKAYGVPDLHRPHPAPLITPRIFKDGAATKLTRNTCLYVEPISGPQGKLPLNGHGTAQLGTTPDYLRDENSRIYSANGPGWVVDKKGKLGTLPKGYTCVAWPAGSELLAKYRRPDEAIILPAVRRLRERQWSCLFKTLVSAYVRPVKVGDLVAHGAFVGPQGSHAARLRDRCLEARQKLLVNEARFTVILKDVDQVDPVFAQKLRDAGVNNSPAQMQAAKQKLAGGNPKADPDPVPPPIPPIGGLPFDQGDQDDGPTVPTGRRWARYAVAGVGGLALLKLFRS